jgi:G3E family GTPase
MKPRHLPVTVVGGYLGSGKTTLLNHMLTQAAGLRLAVIVNDFGRINIDAGLIAAHAGDTISLTNGCMCCAASDGTAETLARVLARAGEFDLIVIETSGVAEPGKIARMARAFRLPVDGVIVLADAEQLPDQATNRYTGHVVAGQLGQADLILLNKTDLAGPDRLAATRAVIAGAAPETPVIETIHARLPLAVLLEVSREAGGWQGRQAEAQDNHATAYRSGLLEYDLPMTRGEFDSLAADLTARYVRAKGHVALAETTGVRHLYQQVGRRWSLSPAGPWGNVPRATRIVTIAVNEKPTQPGSRQSPCP